MKIQILSLIVLSVLTKKKFKQINQDNRYLDNENTVAVKHFGAGDLISINNDSGQFEQDRVYGSPKHLNDIKSFNSWSQT